MHWTINGISGRGAVPSLAGKFTGNLLIVSTAWNVWIDLERFAQLKLKDDEYEVMAVNGMALYWRRRLHHAVSLHAEEPGLWCELRKHYACDLNHTYTHSLKAPSTPACHVDFVWNISRRGGTSSLFAVSIALAMGYTRIMLAGIPLDNRGYCYAPPNNQSEFAGRTMEIEWMSAKNEIFNGRVRSFSGRTKEWLGEPDVNWIERRPQTGDAGKVVKHALEG